MPIEGIDREELEKLAEKGAFVPASLLLAVVIRLEQVEAELADLRRNSRNSSKPPSSDRHNPNKPKKDEKKPGRLKGRKGKRKPGGQKGHAGKTLEQVATPDHVVEHRLDRHDGKCEHCQKSLRGAKHLGFEKRQVHDLPENIRTEVTEHRAEKARCACCGKKVKGIFPGGIRAAAQYGPRIKSLIVYLQPTRYCPANALASFSRMSLTVR